MKINIIGKNLKVNDHIKEKVNESIQRLDKFFESEVNTNVTLSHVKNSNVAEITLMLKHGVVLRAEEEASSMEIAVEESINKIIRQLRKHKTNIEKKFRKNESIRFEMIDNTSDELEEETIEIIKTKRFSVKPMNAEEAVLQMNMLNHDFYVFMNDQTDDINVVYRRKDAKYGLIEPDFD